MKKGSPVSSQSPSPTANGRAGASRRRALIVAGVAGAVLIVPSVAYAAGSFSDVPSKNAYAKDVKAAVGAGVMAGCSKTKFCPKSPATRQDVARLANRLGALTPGGKPIVNAKTALTALDAINAGKAANADHATSADSATTASNAASLGGVAASNFLQNSGQILITAPNITWQQFSSTDSDVFVYYSNSTNIHSTAASFGGLVENSVSTPTALFGMQTSLVGVQLCYQASATAYISYVEVNVPNADVGSGVPSQNQVFSDSTTRTDSTCRVYKPALPVSLGSNSAVNIYLQFNLTQPAASLTLANTTFIFAPTSTPVTPLAKKVTTLKGGKSRLSAPQTSRR